MSGSTTARCNVGVWLLAHRGVGAAAVLALLGCYSSGVELAAGPDAGRTDDDGAAEDAAHDEADGDRGETVRPPCTVDHDCDDANPCTRDECRRDGAGSAACVSVAVDGGACNDGDVCTAGDVCTGGLCRGAPISCDDGDPCTHDGCSPATGCRHPRTDVYYRDDDGDDWGSGGEAGCGLPVPPGFAVRDGDCCDTDAEVHPEAPFHDAPYACDAAGLPSFDWDCDGLETRESTELASDCTADLLSCLGVAPGWCAVDVRHPECTGVPDCGAGGIWQAGCTLVPSPDGGTGGSAVVDASGARRPDAGLPDGRDARRLDGGDARTAKESPARDDGSRDDVWESGEVEGWVCVASLEPRTQRCR